MRTSPDHGTAFDIAGRGAANGASMIAAIEYAWRAVSGVTAQAAARRRQKADARSERSLAAMADQHNHQGRARAQSQEHRPRDSARSPGRDHRALGFGQILARLRHDLRRGAAPLRRVAVGVCAPVPGADGKAGRRFDRGAVAGDFDRAEDHLAQSALDRRHHHRDLRLPAPAVRARRPRVLLQLRTRNHAAERAADRRSDHGVARGHADPRARADRARSQGRVSQGAERSAPRRIRARQNRRQAVRARRGDRAQQESAPHHRGDGRSARDSQRDRKAAGRLARSRLQVRAGPAQDRAARRPRTPARSISASASPASSAAFRIRRSRRACFPSTARMARARNARASDRSCTSIPSWWCRTRT